MNTLIPYNVETIKLNPYVFQTHIGFPPGVDAAVLIPQLDPPDKPLADALMIPTAQQIQEAINLFLSNKTINPENNE